MNPALWNWPVNTIEGTSSDVVLAPVARRRFQMTVGKMMAVIFVAGCLVGLFILVDRAVQVPVPRRAICTNNLKQIGLALENYQAAYGVFPPAYFADETGKPVHSWRVLILPYLEEEKLYAEYDFSEPWDGPHNSKLLAKMPRVYSCPARDQAATQRPSRTSYVAVTGPGTMFPGSESIGFDQVTDGSANTLMVAEIANVEIPWTKPEDLDIRTMSLKLNDKQNPSISSDHPGGAQVLFADGSCRLLSRIRADVLRSLLTIAGGERIETE